MYDVCMYELNNVFPPHMSCTGIITTWQSFVITLRPLEENNVANFNPADGAAIHDWKFNSEQN